MRRILLIGVVLVLAGGGYAVWRAQRAAVPGKVRNIDLSGYFNALSDTPWYLPVYRSNDLASLHYGIRTLGGVEFAITPGLIQLSGRTLARDDKRYPVSVTNILVNQRFGRLHLLHGSVHYTSEGSPVGLVTLHYAEGGEEVLMLNYGYHLRHWWHHAGGSRREPPPAMRSADTVGAWTGTNAQSREGDFQWLFRSTFQNPRPGRLVQAMDYTSVMSRSAPFLLAVTVD